jgi:hypothetical protein
MAALIFLEDGTSSLLQEQSSKLMQENGPGSYLETVSDTAIGVDTVVDTVPGMRTASGSFNVGTTQTNLTITGLGFKPKAIIFWGTANTASNSADLTDANIGFGFTDGTNSQAIAMASLGGNAGAKGWDRQAGVAYLQIDTASATIKTSLSLVSMNTDGFTLSQGVVPAASYYVNYLAIGGDDVTNAKVGTFSYTAATGSKAITGVGFQPDMLMVISNTVTNTTDNNTMFMIGSAVSATDQAVMMYHSGDSNNPTIVEHHTRYGQIIALSSVFGGASFNEAAKLSSFDSDGFTLNVTTNTNHPPMFYLALKGGKYGMGSITPTTSTGSITKTGLGFKPKALFMGATNSPQTTTDTGMDSGGGITIGAAASSTSEQSIWIGDANGVTTSISNSYAQQGYLYRNYTPSATAPTATGAISLNSFDADGFTLSQDIAESSATNFAWWLAMGSTPVAGSGTTYTETPSDTIVSADSSSVSRSQVSSVSDTVVSVDAVTSALTILASISDTATTVDSLSNTQVMVAAVSDTAVSVDSSTATRPINDSASDTATSVDSSTATQNQVSTVSDTGIIADSLFNTQVMVVAASDTATTVDTQASAQAMLAAISDTATTVDTSSVSRSQVESLVDIGVSADSSTATRSNSEILTDTATTVDTSSVSRVLISSVSDTGIIADSLTTTETMSLTVADVATSADSQASIQNQVSSVSDTVISSDSSIAAGTINLAVSDVATSSDSLTTTGVLTATVSDTAIVTDSQAAIAVLPATASDTATSSDSSTVSRDLFSSVSDTATTVDSASAGVGVMVTDTVVSSDSSSSTSVMTAAVTDTVTSADSQTSSQTMVVSKQDTATTVDSVLTGYFDLVTDASSTTDSSSNSQVQTASPQDAAQVVDTVQTTAVFTENVKDTVASSDSSLTGFSYALTVTDVITGSDSSAAGVAMTGSVTAPIISSDQAQALAILANVVADQIQSQDQAVATGIWHDNVRDTIISSDFVRSDLEAVYFETVVDQITIRDYVDERHVLVEEQKYATSGPQSCGCPQQPLVKALTLPLRPGLTQPLGIHQSDIIIRSAIVAAMADMRANPWLLDYVFSSLPRDSLTMADYGEKEVAAAKRWFLTTDIPVVMNTRIGEVQLPAISISLKESTEAETTLGDVHYKPHEDALEFGQALAGPFNPKAYNAATGIMVLDESTADSIVLAPGMIVIDAIGKVHEILEVLDRNMFAIAPGTVADFECATIRGSRRAIRVELESVNYKETYSIGCHAQGESVFTTYLHSILCFILLRYKETLLEARGFERSSFNSSDQMLNEQFENELTFSRWVTINGYVRQYWPKNVTQRITSVSPEMRIANGGKLPPETDPDDSLWMGDEDMLSLKLR